MNVLAPEKTVAPMPEKTLDFDDSFTLDFSDKELSLDEEKALPAELQINEDVDTAENDEQDVTPPRSTLATVEYVVARGFKALDSDDRPMLKAALDGGMTAEYTRETDEYLIEWPRVNSQPTDFIRVTMSNERQGCYEVSATVPPQYNKNGVTAEADEHGRNVTTPQAIGTFFPKDESGLAMLVGRMVRNIQQKRDVEKLIEDGLVECVTENIKGLLKAGPNLPLKAIADHNSHKPVTAYFMPVSDRGSSTHIGIVVATPGNGIVVVATGVRASYMIHQLGKQARRVEPGDAVQIRYAMDQRLSSGIQVIGVDANTIASQHESLTGLKVGRPLADRRELAFAPGVGTPLPKMHETPLKNRILTCKPIVRERDRSR